jgi:hypothetical protein
MFEREETDVLALHGINLFNEQWVMEWTFLERQSYL